LIFVTYFAEKGWSGTRIAPELPNKKWSYQSINQFLAKYLPVAMDREHGHQCKSVCTTIERSHNLLA